MATKIPVAQKRMFQNVFVCKDCNKKIRTQAGRILAGKVRCNRCGGHAFKPVRRK